MDHIETNCAFLWLRPLFPPLSKLQIVQDMDSHSAEYTAPGIIIPCASVCLPKYVKIEIVAPREWPLSRWALCSHLSATYGNLMEKHPIARWNISSFLLCCCRKTLQQEALCSLTKDERRFFALRGGTQSSGINSML